MKKLNYSGWGYHYVLLFIFISGTSHAQYLEKITSINTAHNNVNAGACRLKKYDGDMYLFADMAAWSTVLFDEEEYPGIRVDSLSQHRKRDYHFFQFDENHEILRHFSIDNGSRRSDFAKTKDHFVTTIRNYPDFVDEDTLAVLTVEEGIEIDTPLQDLQGHILVHDNDFRFQYMHQLCIGEIQAIEASDSVLYFAAIIPDFDSLIVCGGDTIWNYKFFGQYGSNSKTIVIGTFDLRTKTYGWMWPFGGKGSDELWYFDRDKEGNLLVLLHASSVYLPNGDTLRSYYTGNQVIKLNPSGDVLFTTDFIESEGEFLNTVYQDDEGSVYVSGYAGGYLTTQDSILLSDSEYMAVLYKFSAAGEEQWVRRLKGTDLFGLAYSSVVSDDYNLYVAGTSLDGTYELTGKTYTTKPGDRDRFIQKLDAKTGKDIGHLRVEGESLRYLRAIVLDKNDDLHFVVNFDGKININGVELDHGDARSSELIKVRQFWTDVKETRQRRTDLFSLAPNICHRGETLHITYNQSFPADGELLIIDSQGFVVVNLSKNDALDTSKFVAGQYFIYYLNDESFQEEKFIVLSGR